MRVHPTGRALDVGHVEYRAGTDLDHVLEDPGRVRMPDDIVPAELRELLSRPSGPVRTNISMVVDAVLAQRVAPVMPGEREVQIR